MYARAGRDARARDAYERAIALCRAPEGAFDATRIEALRALALSWRRARAFTTAAVCWQRILDTRGCPPAAAREATEALAIHHEHRVRDLEAARTFALRAFEAGLRPSQADAARHRLARIRKKLERRSGGETGRLKLEA